MNRGNQGFTLIELMVVLAILAITLATGLPLARGWVQNTQQVQARNMVRQAMAQARSLALRNPHGLTADTAVIELKLAGSKLQVLPAGSSSAAWSATLPDATSITLVGADGAVASLACVAFNNRGARLADATGCSTAGMQAHIAVNVGGTSRGSGAAAQTANTQDALYVDLL